MSLISRTDVTAVKFYKSYVLAGIGSYLYVFCRGAATFLKRIHVLTGQKIYGFVPSKFNSKILVFGGKQFTVLSVEDVLLGRSEENAEFTRLFEPVVCDDWIHSAVWTEENVVALLTAHNVVQKWEISKQAFQSQHESKDNSILYSGLLLPIQGDLLVFAGTVFSEVIIHRCSDEKPLHHLKGHRGVIFSISCDQQKEIIVTTSDDRSVRIWQMQSKYSDTDTKHYWENINIVCKHELYGHTARVMRNSIINDYIISVGEDSAICFWDYEGNIARKVVTHQNGCIWALDGDKDHLVTGGGDCAIILHPVTVAFDYGVSEVIDIAVSMKNNEQYLPVSAIGDPNDNQPPIGDGTAKLGIKRIVFTARKKIVMLNESDELIYFDIETTSKMVYKLIHESTYKLLSISSCKQLVAVADMCGKLNVFTENCKDTPYLQGIINTKLHIGKILSMQWAGNRHLVFCSENGAITVLASIQNTTEVYANFVLPSFKERWLTASAVDTKNKTFVLGDRCGNIHVYVKGQTDPIKTFSKVHGRFGPTSIIIKNNRIITTGRDGTIKYFSINSDSQVKYLCCKELDFQWPEKFLDKDENLICGFHERVFVVYNIKTNSKLLEVPCGGGHRTWDAVRYIEKHPSSGRVFTDLISTRDQLNENDDYEEFIRLVYLKNSNIHLSTYQMSKIVSKNVVNGSHSKEINCLITYRTELDYNVTFYISGGEDTTLRISSINMGFQFQDEAVFKQLSSIRALRFYSLGNNQILLISAGGRAQICAKIVIFEKINEKIKLTTQHIVDYLIKGTDKERKGNKTWRNCSVDFDPETRIMDLDVITVDDKDFIIYAGCSDAYLRIFKLTYDPENVSFKPIKEIKHHKTCILKTNHIKFLNKHVLVTCTTRGIVTFWDLTDDPKVVFTTTTNKSGINCFASTILTDTLVLIATGGDDNSLHMNLLEIPDRSNLESMRVSHTWRTDKLHCSQITGLVLLNDVVISASIDQRITMCEYKINAEGIKCDFISQAFSDVADIQGIDLMDDKRAAVTVCVFGRGFEVVSLPRSSRQ